jgi:hypothetical protein
MWGAPKFEALWTYRELQTHPIMRSRSGTHGSGVAVEDEDLQSPPMEFMAYGDIRLFWVLSMSHGCFKHLLVAKSGSYIRVIKDW